MIDLSGQNIPADTDQYTGLLPSIFPLMLAKLNKTYRPKLIIPFFQLLFIKLPE